MCTTMQSLHVEKHNKTRNIITCCFTDFLCSIQCINKPTFYITKRKMIYFVGKVVFDIGKQKRQMSMAAKHINWFARNNMEVTSHFGQRNIAVKSINNILTSSI